jgi:hypothetical protein
VGLGFRVLGMLGSCLRRVVGLGFRVLGMLGSWVRCVLVWQLQWRLLCWALGAF